MKKTFIVALALMMSGLGMAQTIDNRALSYSVTYEKQHLFLQKDSSFNVVDYDIEWPAVIDFDDAAALKKVISQSITKMQTTGLDTLLNNISAIYGKPVTGPFKTIPDDDRFCYVTANAKIMGYKKGHWIAYYLEDVVAPQKKSEFLPRREIVVLVYDITKDKIYTADDLLSNYVIQRAEPQEFYDQLYAPLSDDMFNNMTSCQIQGVWTEGDNLCFLVNASTEDQQVDYVANMPMDYFSYVLSRDGRRVFTKEVKRKAPTPIPAPLTWHGDSIYNNVEKMPEFKGGQDGLRQYLSQVPSPGVKLLKQARVYTSFIVDKEGSVQDVNVVAPANPILDRHAASIIKGMPKFTPGEHNGKKVCVRLYMPINYK